MRVTLIDRHNFHAFLPAAVPGRHGRPRAGRRRLPDSHDLRPREERAGASRAVARVDRERRTVTLEGGDEIAYDYLIVATGAVASYFNIPGASATRCPSTRWPTRGDCATGCCARSKTPRSPTSRASGRSTSWWWAAVRPGVETAGALSELIDIAIRRDGLRIDPDRCKIRLVDVAPRLLTAFPERRAVRAAPARGDGRECRVGPLGRRGRAHAIRFADGERLEAAAVVWAGWHHGAGHARRTTRRPRGDRTGAPWWARTCACVDSDSVFCVGDAAAIPTRRRGLLPQLAPVAIQSGVHRAPGDLRLLAGETDRCVLATCDKGIMATIGRRAAVAKIPHAPVITGTLGWMAWLGLHLFYLVGFRNRLRVVINWTWRYFDWPSGPRLIVADAETSTN